MRRREFIATFGSAAMVASNPAGAQSSLPVVGFISLGTSGSSADILAGFRRGLAETGLTEGRDFVLAPYWAMGDAAKLPAGAAELVQRKVAVIAAGGPPAIRAVMAATSGVPIVFMSGDDPVKAGFVASLARPGGDATGVAFLAQELAAKRFALAQEIAPKADLFAMLVDRTPGGAAQQGRTETEARRQGKRLLVLEASTPSEIASAFERAAQQMAGALLVSAEPFYFSQNAGIAETALKHAIAVASFDRQATKAGSLMSYGADIVDAFRLAGVYTARILRGAKPSDLAVQQPTKFETVLNLKTAKALGLTIPPLLLAQADEVFE
jgi:putative ABC transport system substrate-binding protein